MQVKLIFFIGLLAFGFVMVESKTLEFLIMQQLSKDCQGVPTITPEDLETHQRILTKLVKASVTFAGRNWNFWNMCERPTIPTIPADFQGMLQGFAKTFPMCQISSPLECFNEGGAVRGPHPKIELSALKRFILKLPHKYIHWQNTAPMDFLKSIQRVAQKFIRPATFSSVVSYYNSSGMKPGVGYTNKPCYNPNTEFCSTAAEDVTTMIGNCSGSLLTAYRNIPIYGQLSTGIYDVLISTLPFADPEVMKSRMDSVVENPQKSNFSVAMFREIQKLWLAKLDSLANDKKDLVTSGILNTTSNNYTLQFVRSKSVCVSASSKGFQFSDIFIKDSMMQKLKKAIESTLNFFI